MINAFVSLLAAAVLFAGGFTYDVPDIMMPDTDRDGSADVVDAEPLIDFVVIVLDQQLFQELRQLCLSDQLGLLGL